tara:strand:- start:207 stop:431 length:225 start_codon:yes stop_codon:yes gene_type:complete
VKPSPDAKTGGGEWVGKRWKSGNIYNKGVFGNWLEFVGIGSNLPDWGSDDPLHSGGGQQPLQAPRIPVELTKEV